MSVLIWLEEFVSFSTAMSLSNWLIFTTICSRSKVSESTFWWDSSRCWPISAILAEISPAENPRLSNESKTVFIWASNSEIFEDNWPFSDSRDVILFDFSFNSSFIELTIGFKEFNSSSWASSSPFSCSNFCLLLWLVSNSNLSWFNSSESDACFWSRSCFNSVTRLVSWSNLFATSDFSFDNDSNCWDNSFIFSQRFSRSEIKPFFSSKLFSREETDDWRDEIWFSSDSFSFWSVPISEVCIFSEFFKASSLLFKEDSSCRFASLVLFNSVSMVLKELVLSSKEAFNKCNSSAILLFSSILVASSDCKFEIDDLKLVISPTWLSNSVFSFSSFFAVDKLLSREEESSSTFSLSLAISPSSSAKRSFISCSNLCNLLAFSVNAWISSSFWEIMSFKDAEELSRSEHFSVATFKSCSKLAIKPSNSDSFLSFSTSWEDSLCSPSDFSRESWSHSAAFCLKASFSSSSFWETEFMDCSSDSNCSFRTLRFFTCSSSDVTMSCNWLYLEQEISNSERYSSADFWIACFSFAISVSFSLKLRLTESAKDSLLVLSKVGQYSANWLSR